MASTVRKDKDQLQDYKKSQQVGTFIADCCTGMGTAPINDLPAYAGLL